MKGIYFQPISSSSVDNAIVNCLHQLEVSYKHHNPRLCPKSAIRCHGLPRRLVEVFLMLFGSFRSILLLASDQDADGLL